MLKAEGYEVSISEDEVKEVIKPKKSSKHIDVD